MNDSHSIFCEGKAYDVESIISQLYPFLTEARKNKFHKVISQRRSQLSIVLENIYDRGNASAVMRTQEAFGYHQIHHIVIQDEFKKSQRVTQGADKWLIQRSWISTPSCVTHLKERGYKIFVTQLKNAKPIEELDFSEPVALCFGNERDGASSHLMEMADENVQIPMYGFTQSFNISVAAALCLQHIRKVHHNLNLPGLSREEYRKLLAHYLLRNCKNLDATLLKLTPQLPS